MIANIMETYIALLRGINVSGQKKIKMAELRYQLTSLHFENIQTYIQSGNIIFQYESNEHSILEQKIKSLIQAEYGFDVPVLVKTAADFRKGIAQHPHAGDTDKDPRQIHFTFLSAVPESDRVALLKEGDYKNEAYTLDRDTIYLYTPDGYGRAKLNNNFLERKLKVQATTRNLKTIKKLLELSEKSES